MEINQNFDLLKSDLSSATTWHENPLLSSLFSGGGKGGGVAGEGLMGGSNAYLK